MPHCRQPPNLARTSLDPPCRPDMPGSLLMRIYKPFLLNFRINDLADFIYTNYDKVTGLRKSMRNDEMDFPTEIMDLVDHYGFDVDDFTDKYSMAAESVVTEATSYDPDDIFFLWDDCVDNGREGIERGHTGSGSNKHELFTFDTEVDGYDKFETELKKLLKKMYLLMDIFLL